MQEYISIITVCVSIITLNVESEKETEKRLEELCVIGLVVNQVLSGPTLINTRHLLKSLSNKSDKCQNWGTRGVVWLGRMSDQMQL